MAMKNSCIANILLRWYDNFHKGEHAIMKKKPIQIAARIAQIILIILLVIMALHMSIAAINTGQNPYTSFPWWSAIVFLGLYYFLPVLSVAIIAVMLTYKAKKHEQKTSSTNSTAGE